MDWLTLPSIGAAGGILIFWDKNKFKVLDSVLGTLSMSLKCWIRRDKFDWFLSEVYGPTDGALFSSFLEELRSSNLNEMSLMYMIL